MSDCCTPGSGFPNAALMQQMATNNSIVWKEICMLQQAILEASSQCQVGGGKMCVTVGGNTPMTFVSGVESVTVNDGGSGYIIDTPTVYFEPPYNSTEYTLAAGTVITNGSSIMGITVTDGGNGYSPIRSTLNVSSVSGMDAVLEPLVNAAGQIISVNIVNPGSGYTTDDSVTAIRSVQPNPAYVNATFLITAVSVTGEILSVIVTNPGSGYQDSVATARIVSSIDPTLSYPLGTGFMGIVATDMSGAVTGVNITNPGFGYADLHPYMIITDPGIGATTSVQLNSGSVGSVTVLTLGATTSVQLNSGSVGSVTVLTSGTNYTQNASGTVVNPSTAPEPTFADVTVNVSNNTFGTDPQLYWQVWAGAATDKQISIQLNAVLSYFKGLGYTIIIHSNPVSTNTIQWKICW